MARRWFVSSCIVSSTRAAPVDPRRLQRIWFVLLSCGLICYHPNSSLATTSCACGGRSEAAGQMVAHASCAFDRDLSGSSIFFDLLAITCGTILGKEAHAALRSVYSFRSFELCGLICKVVDHDLLFYFVRLLVPRRFI